MTPPVSIQPLLSTFKQTVKGIYGERLIKVLLYGSYARGEQHDESDIDVMVVLKDEGFDKKKDKELLYSVQLDLSLHYKMWVSPKVISRTRFENDDLPFFHFVRQDQLLVK